MLYDEHGNVMALQDLKDYLFEIESEKVMSPYEYDVLCVRFAELQVTFEWLERFYATIVERRAALEGE